MSFLFLLKIRQLITKIKSNKVIKNNGYKLVVIKNDTHAFSFFNYVFLGEEVYKKDYKTVLKHELIHVKQKHSFDLLFFEIQKIICWFNPFSYLFQRRISVLHEYIADEKNHSQKDNKVFFESLLYQTFNVENISFVNNYYKKSLLKKRIIMATKNKSKELLKMKYLLVLPILLLMFIYANAIEHKSEKLNLINKDTFKLAVNDSLTPITIPFKSIEKTPVYPGCDPSETEYELKTCFVNKIFVHTYENFNAKGLQNIGLSPGSKRVHVRFVIDTNGNVINIEARAPHPKLQEEAIRTIQLLPQMKPGMQNGKKVSVQYTLPIIFKIEGETTEKSNIVISKSEIKALPFSKINQIPIFPGCESLKNEQEKKVCFTKKITQHVSKNFNTKAMKETGLPSGRKRISVQFIIDNNGNVIDVKARAPHPKLQEEAIRTINLLPKMKPGIDENGKKVNVRYNLPIVFNLENDKEKKSK